MNKRATIKTICFPFVYACINNLHISQEDVHILDMIALGILKSPKKCIKYQGWKISLI